jgi:hypothetical protein
MNNSKLFSIDMNDYENAFKAAIAYERNCRLKYDKSEFKSLPIPKGEQMIDFAMRFGTTVKMMKIYELEAEQHVDYLFQKP